jgi:signal transduction histidine kinase
MRLAQFILQNLEPLLAQWEAFARTILPSRRAVSSETLRDHARLMLETIALDMETAQSAGDQHVKSEGRRRRVSKADSASETHADERHGLGFTINEVVAEYRALRASVIQMWTREMGSADRENLDELTRFNEALDEGLTEAIARFTDQVENERDLLLGALGHDLRTPLSAVLHSAQFLMRAELAGDSQSKAVVRIVNSTNRMRAMISDLLDLAQTRLGEPLPVAKAHMNLGEACRSTIEELTSIHSGCSISFDAVGNLQGHWDAARIGQMLSNLIGNAIDHGRKGGQIEVKCYVSESDGTVGVSVQNEGIPIPNHLRPRIFQPMARGIQAPPQVAASGRSLGLGLYIASEIAKAHGGTLELAFSDDRGTAFVAHLPRGVTQPRLEAAIDPQWP